MPDQQRGAAAPQTTRPDGGQFPDPRPPVAQGPQVNVGTVLADAGSMGLSGWTKLAGNVTAMAMIAGCFLFAFNYIVTTGRADRLEDRQLFREAVRQLQDDAARHTAEFNDQQNRRMGEMVGGLEVNTRELRNLISEIRALRRVGVLKSEGAEPKAGPPPEK